jgi:hypothetical protein
MRFIDRALAHAGGRNGERRHFLKLRERVVRAGKMHAAAGDDKRILRPGDELRGFRDAGGIRDTAIERIRAEHRLARGVTKLRARGFEQKILRTQQHRRTGATARGGGERHVHVILDARDLGHAANPFRAAAEDIEVVELLECVAIGLRAPHVLHDRDDGDRRLERLCERRCEQRRRRPVLRGHDGHFVRGARIAVGHGASRVLRAVRDLPDAELRRHEIERRRQALPEHDFDAMARERTRHEVRAARVRQRVTGRLRREIGDRIHAGILRGRLKRALIVYGAAQPCLRVIIDS